MLQQTQVDTVIPYYHRFLTSFPTIHSLAGASLDDVLKAWENLGYYARARHMHACAKEIVNRLGGKFPETQKELIQLPGIGDYTAGAILSIAFGSPCAAVDANIRRVIARLFAIRTPLDDSRTKRDITALAERLVPEKSPGDFNQGMMDLGATICVPGKPKCRNCPVRNRCRAFLEGLQKTIPVVKKGRPSPTIIWPPGSLPTKGGEYSSCKDPTQVCWGDCGNFQAGKSSRRKPWKPV
jgi:A/G-specific adenine glycosylase